MSDLCYLDASNVESPVGVLSELPLLAPDGTPLGTIKGVVIEPAAGRVRYFDIESGSIFRRRRYWLEADQLAQIEPERNALRLRIDPSTHELKRLDRQPVRRFCDDDLLAALFSTRAA